MIHRVFGIWSSVGLGHLVVLGTLLSGPSADLSEGGMITVELLDAEPAAPVAVALPLPSVDLAPSARLEQPSVRIPVSTRSGIDTSPAAAPAPSSAAAPSASPPPVSASQVGEPPRFLQRVEPIYPPRAQRAGLEGTVQLRLRLSSGGRLLGAEVIGGSGSPALDAAALEAARASRYEPARLDGAPVASETEATYRFELR
jgi:TonB family protein